MLYAPTNTQCNIYMYVFYLSLSPSFSAECQGHVICSVGESLVYPKAMWRWAGAHKGDREGQERRLTQVLGV